MTETFTNIVPYLKEPLVLMGFFLFIAFSFCRYLVKKGVIPTLPKTLGYRILRLIFLYGFILGLVLVILGFELKRQELINQKETSEHFESMLRDVFSRAPWVSEEKKIEIIHYVKEAYRSGAMSKEQIQEKVEQISNSLTRSPDNDPIATTIHQHQSRPSVQLNPETSSARSEVAANDDRSSSGNQFMGGGGLIGTERDTTYPKLDLRPTADDRGLTIVLPTSTTPALSVLAAPNSRCAVAISSPKPKAEVREHLTVEGSAALPERGRLLILSGKKGLKDHMEYALVSVNEEGKWGAEISLKGEIAIYEIAAVVIDKADTTLIALANLLPQLQESQWDVNIPSISKGCSIVKVEVQKVAN
jgi:hypothetical protein